MCRRCIFSGLVIKKALIKISQARHFEPAEPRLLTPERRLPINNGQQCCFNSNQYSGYVSCTCAAGTWVPQYSYYQVQVSSNGQCQGFNGFNGFNRFGKRSTDKVALLEEEVKRMAIKHKEM